MDFREVSEMIDDSVRHEETAERLAEYTEAVVGNTCSGLHY